MYIISELGEMTLDMLFKEDQNVSLQRRVDLACQLVKVSVACIAWTLYTEI